LRKLEGGQNKVIEDRELALVVGHGVLECAEEDEAILSSAQAADETHGRDLKLSVVVLSVPIFYPQAQLGGGMTHRERPESRQPILTERLRATWVALDRQQPGCRILGTLLEDLTWLRVPHRTGLR